MDPQVAQALNRDLVIDMTTIGRTSGVERTVEIWFHRVDGRYYITGWPGRRAWYANLLANPHFTITFTQSGGVKADALAHPITDASTRRVVIGAVFEVEGGPARGSFDLWLTSSPVIEFEVVEPG